MTIEETRRNSRILVRKISEFGPRNLSTLSRETGISESTVRYTVEKHLLGKGVEIHTDIDRSRLGLRRAWISFRDGPDGAWRPEVLEDLPGQLYVDVYGSAFPNTDHVLLASYPRRHESAYRSIWDSLEREGQIDRLSFDPLDWTNPLVMDPEYYRFTKRSWKIDWSSLADRSVEVAAPPTERETTNPDSVDVRIIRELQRDPIVHLSEVSERLDVTYRVTYYHYTRHVEDRGLIRGYAPQWKEPDEEVDEHTPRVLHRVETGEDQLDEVRRVFHRVPFLQHEGYSSAAGAYYAFSAVPPEESVDLNFYLARELGALKETYTQTQVNPVGMKSFLLPEDSFEEGVGWTLDGGEALSAILGEGH